MAVNMEMGAVLSTRCT